MKLNIQLFAEQTILSSKQSTSGSPYVIYTVKVTPSNRTLTTVDLYISITAHLKNSSSSLGTGSGYGIKGRVTVAGQDLWFDGGSGNGPLIKGTGSSWSGTTNHTVSHTFTVSSLTWDVTSLATTFYAIRTSNSTSNAGYLKTTDCTAITIEQAAAPSTITEIVGGGGITDYAPSVKWTPKDSSFKFKLIYSYGSWANYNINNAPFIYPNTTSEHTYSSYTIQGSDVAPYMSSATADFTATLYTYDSSGNQIGSANSKTFKVTLNPNTYKPTASIGAFSDAGGIVPSSWGIYVAGKSKLSFNVSASASAGSSISSYSTSVNGKTYTTTSITTDWLSSSGSANLTVTDSRGRTGSASSGYSAVAYATPDIDLTGYRAGSTGTAAGNGTYYHYIISGHIQSCKNGSTEKNSVSEIKIGYRVAGSSSAFSYETISATMGSTSNNRVAFTAEGTVFGGNLSTANNYEIRAYLKDGLGVESYDIESVGAEFKLLSYTADGTGIAIGKKATTSNKVDVVLNTEISNGKIAKSSPTWWMGGRTDSVARNTAKNNDSYNPVAGSMAYQGDWSWGTLGNNAFFVYTKDSDFELQNNVTHNLEVSLQGGYYCEFNTSETEFKFDKQVVGGQRFYVPSGVGVSYMGDGVNASQTLSNVGTGSTCLSYCQTDQSYFGSSADWAHYIICNHGDGATYYNFMIRMPFWGVPEYQRQMGNTGSRSGWQKFVTAENYYQYHPFSGNKTAIGTWIDNSTVYRKVVTLSGMKKGNNYPNYDLGGLNTLISVRGAIYINGAWEPISRTVTDGNGTYGIGVGDVYNGYCLLQIGSSYTNIGTGYLVFEYT